MAAENEIEELQLQLESKVCGPGLDALAQLAEHLQVKTKELVKQKGEVDFLALFKFCW